MPIRLALVNDYEVVVRGLAEMLRSYADEFDIVELDADMPVMQPVGHRPLRHLRPGAG